MFYNMQLAVDSGTEKMPLIGDRQARTQDFRMGGGARPSGWAPHADGPPAEKGATDDEGDFCWPFFGNIFKENFG